MSKLQAAWCAALMAVSQAVFAGVFAEGGSITEADGYRLHTFSTIGTATLAVTSGGKVEVLVVAGGGGGGYNVGGGGGSHGGGHGANGGSGGGGAGYTTPGNPGAGQPGQGNDGGPKGTGSAALTGGAGGGAGGPGGPGVQAISGYSTGGVGVACSISGASVTYATGGRGGGDSWLGLAAGAPNSGNGGDGAGNPNTGKNGGSGIVIVKYAAIPGAPLIDGTRSATTVTPASAWLNGTLVSTGASNASMDIADAGVITLTWTGAGANAYASTPSNWAGGVAPMAGDAILLDATTNKNMTWDLNIPIQSWTQVGYTGTVTVDTIYGPGGFTNFVILGDCVISNGVWTQTPNPNNVNYETNRLCATIGGNLTVGPDGAIDVTRKGYTARMGPG